MKKKEFLVFNQKDIGMHHHWDSASNKKDKEASMFSSVSWKTCGGNDTFKSTSRSGFVVFIFFRFAMDDG